MKYTTEDFIKAIELYTTEDPVFVWDGYCMCEMKDKRKNIIQIRNVLIKENINLIDTDIYLIFRWHCKRLDSHWLCPDGGYSHETYREIFEEFVTEMIDKYVIK